LESGWEREGERQRGKHGRKKKGRGMSDEREKTGCTYRRFFFTTSNSDIEHQRKRRSEQPDHVEGSVHKDSISVYFRFWVFLHHSTDLDEPDKPVTSVFFLISQHRKSYKPCKNGAICASDYLLWAQRFYRSAIFDSTFVPTLIALSVADRSGTKVLCANFIANPVLQRAQRFYLQR